MEKVKVVKAVPGILKVGDVLISPTEGADFCLEETQVTKNGSSERYVSLDYVTVSENIPQFFEFEVDLPEAECFKCGNCEECDCTWTEAELKAQDIQIPGYSVTRSLSEIDSRYNFYSRQFEAATPGSEAQVVYKNLMWLIDWLRGDTELV